MVASPLNCLNVNLIYPIIQTTQAQFLELLAHVRSQTRLTLLAPRKVENIN